MIALLSRAVDYLGSQMSKSMHNYAVALLLILEAGAVLTVLVVPDPVRLDMAKDVGTTLLGALGIVGGVHYGKERARLGIASNGNGGDAAPRPGE